MDRICNHEWKYALALMKELNPHDLQLANCYRLDDNDAVYIFDEVGSGKTITAGLMALHYLWSCRSDDDSSKKVLVLTTNALTQGENGGQFLNDWYSKLPFDALGLKGRVKVINHHPASIISKEDETPGIKKADPSQYGLVIIDEAQEYLNPGSDRYIKLTSAYENNENSFTEKVVFLTATPIKGAMQDSCPDQKAAWEDLKRYSDIAKFMLEPNYQKSHPGRPWVEKKGWRKPLMEKPQPSREEDLICASFDPYWPVTRYFKDTVHNLDPKQKKEFVLLKKMHEILEGTDEKEGDPQARFLIFVRYVEESEKSPDEDANYLFNYLSQGDCGIDGFPGKVVAVTGKWRSDGLGHKGTDLSDYTGTDDSDKLPRVLILTYQIAEAGVNLPGFNHVVNYHISRFPSALEQRFGRVDRSNSLHKQIYACYLLDKSRKWDTNTNNFHRAVSTALKGLMPLLPSRNAILSEDILREHIKEMDRQERFINEIAALLEQDCAYEAYQIFQRPAESRLDIEDETIKKLIRFFEDLEKNGQKAKNADEDDGVNLGKFGKDIGSKDAFDREAKRIINNMRRNWRETFSSGMDPEKYIHIIQKFQNDIFYMPADWKEQPGQELADSLKGIKLETCRDLVRESMKKSAPFLYPSAGDIGTFREKELKAWENTLKEHEERLNQYFCKLFAEGRLYDAFPNVYGFNFSKALEETVEFYRECVTWQIIDKYASAKAKISYLRQGYENIVKDVSNLNYADPNDSWKFDAQKDILNLNGLLGKGLIEKYCFLYSLRQLPFFKICEEFEASLYKYLLTAKGELPLNGYEEDPFALACYDVREQATALGLTPQSWTKEDLDKMRREELIWKIKNTWLTVEVRGNTVKASIWYQLAAKFFMEHSVFEEYPIIKENPGFKMLPCFYSNWNFLIEGEFGSKPKPRKNVKNPWPDGVDFGFLHSEYGDCFTQYFIDNFH